MTKQTKHPRYARIYAEDHEEIFKLFKIVHAKNALLIWDRLNIVGFNAKGKFFPEPLCDLRRVYFLDNKTIYQSIKRLEDAKFIEVKREKKPGSSLNEINQFKLLRGAYTIGKNDDSNPKTTIGKNDDNIPSSSLTIIKEGGRSTPPNSLNDSNRKKTHKRRDFYANSGGFESPANAKSADGAGEQAAKQPDSQTDKEEC